LKTFSNKGIISGLCGIEIEFIRIPKADDVEHPLVGGFLPIDEPIKFFILPVIVQDN
jgi:hypothetical protein